MEDKTKKRVVGRPFVKGKGMDERINRKGKPRSIAQLRALAQQIGDEKVRDANGNLLTVAEMVLRKLCQSNDAQALRAYLEYGWGKPVDTIETIGFESNKTLHLHFGHEKARVEREQRRLLDNGTDCE